MAKNNNLTDFLTGVADAIRAKKGTTDLINPQDFESEIESISSGGVALNIAYSETEPLDTSKLWIKNTEPTNIKFSPLFSASETLNNLIAALPSTALYIASAAVGTKIYLFGGSSSSGNLNTINVFDTTTNTITTLSTTLPSASYGIASAVVGTKIYLFGGYKSGGNLNTINVFDTTTNTITTLSTTLPSASYYIASTAVGTKIYLFGGILSSGYIKPVNVFDTTTNTITTLSTTLPSAANGIASAAVGTKIYLFGGNGSVYLNTINVFDTTTNTITTLSITLPSAATGITSAAVGTKIYLFGGYSSDYLNQISQFVVSADLISGNILVVTDITSLFSLISSDTVNLEVGIANVYKGNTDNKAEFCDAYLHDGTNWVNVNTGEIYST